MKHSPDSSLFDGDRFLPRPHFRSAASSNSALRKHPTCCSLPISNEKCFSMLELPRWPKEKNIPTGWSKLCNSRGALVQLSS